MTTTGGKEENWAYVWDGGQWIQMRPVNHIEPTEAIGVIGRFFRLCAFPIRYVLFGRAWL